jgi:hypothetical protein
MPGGEERLRDLWKRRDSLWKLKEIVMFALNLKGDGQPNTKNNSLVIHRLITQAAVGGTGTFFSVLSRHFVLGYFH